MESPIACAFSSKASQKSCRLPSEDAACSNPLSPLVYVRYKDHVIYKNIKQPKAEAVERETIGWLTKQNDEIILIEHDRTILIDQISTARATA